MKSAASNRRERLPASRSGALTPSAPVSAAPDCGFKGGAEDVSLDGDLARSAAELFTLLRAKKLSVVTAAAPEEGFALMYESASWGDNDVTWILRENLKKKRLAKFIDHTRHLTSLLP